MKIIDILIPAQRHAAAMEKGVTELAEHSDAKQWTEAAAAWGKIVGHAYAVCELEFPMRAVIYAEAAKAVEKAKESMAAKLAEGGEE